MRRRSHAPRLPRLFIASIVAIALGGVGLVGRQPAAPTLTSIEVMIPMRDGTRLFTQIYTPADATEPLPIVFQRTPYGVGQNTPAGVATALVDLPADGYIIVLQDIRGRFKSEGEFRDAAPAARSQGSEGDRREHRHLRHHRVAAQECARQQRARRHGRHQLPARGSR